MSAKEGHQLAQVNMSVWESLEALAGFVFGGFHAEVMRRRREWFTRLRDPYAHRELLLDEGLEAWSVSETWLMAHPEMNHWVDVTDTFDAKLAALRAHVSQTGHMEGFEERIRGWFGSNAERAGLPEGRLVEGFFVVSTA